ncbi:MAG: ATP-binding protein [Methylococcaceae bacterium]
MKNHNHSATNAHLIPDALQQGMYNTNILVNGIEVSWQVEKGQCYFRGLPVAMMWVDTTLAGVMSGVAAMVGPQRFALALQAEGRKSVESDWLLFTNHVDFAEGFKQLHLNAAIAGWGDWQLLNYDKEQQRCVFRAYNNWEGLYQRSLGVCWGSALLAGKLSGICSKLFDTNCWATQTTFVAQGAEYDEFIVEPSARLLEDEIEKLLLSDQATRADMAVAMKKLQERERQLEQANADLQRFAEVSAHHLMEPTRRLSSYSQRLTKQLTTLNLTAEQAQPIQQNLDYIQRDATLLFNRLRDIQLYLAATEQRKEIRLENVNALLNQVKQHWAHRFIATNASLEVETLPDAYLDQPRLLDLFTLLIDNALKHARSSQVDGSLCIHISGQQQGSLCRYRISDNGIGIEAQYHERVFAIFERLTHSNDLGTGIGLAIARRIVESRHGKIWLENTVPTGTTVIFELPTRTQHHDF